MAEKKAIAGRGDLRFGSGGSKAITSKTQLKKALPNWVSEYKQYKPSSSKISDKALVDEYRKKLDSWLGSEYRKGNINPQASEFRKKFGIIIDEKGNELLSPDFYKKRTRFANEIDQRLSRKQGRQAPKQPDWNQNPDGSKWTSLEGHHQKGLANLSPFFKGASPAEAMEMRQAMLDEGYVAGTDKRNWEWLTGSSTKTNQHDYAHKVLGYVTDEELGTKEFKDVEVYDLDKPGKKGVSNLSPKFKKLLKTLPWTSKDPNYKGQSVYNSGIDKVDMTKYTKKDALMDYLRTTGDAFKQAATTARKQKPLTIPSDRLGGLAETTARMQYGSNINTRSTNKNMMIAPTVPDKFNSKAWKASRLAARGAGQSWNPFVNFGGDVVGFGMDATRFIQTGEGGIDALLSGGQVLTSVGAGAATLLGNPILGKGIQKVGDQLGQAERIYGMGAEGRNLIKSGSLKKVLGKTKLSNVNL